jgi:hypothetical protein
MSAQAIENEPDDEPPGPKTRLMSLSDLDGRTAAAKAAKTLIRDLEADLGGADRLTAGERALVGRAAVTTAMVEDMEARWLLGRPIDVAAYTALVNVQRRLLTTVGLQRRPRDVTPDLQSYIAAQPPAPQREPVTVLPPPPPFPAPPR